MTHLNLPSYEGQIFRKIHVSRMPGGSTEGSSRGYLQKESKA